VNLLIVGALFIFALIAILGAVLLTLSEQRASQAKTTAAAPAPAQKEVAAPSERRGSGQNLPVPRPTTAPVTIEEQNLPALDGRLQQFTAEIRSLHADAIELEHRLGLFEKMVDRMEHTRDGHVSIEEELPVVAE